jgi:hypothetical protein
MLQQLVDTGWVPLIAIPASVFGVVLGVLLRPVVEDWFAQKRKSIHVVLDDPGEIKTPHETVKLEWRNHKIDRILTLQFKILNRTGRTIRNLDIFVNLPNKKKVNDFAYVAFESSKTSDFESDFSEGESTKISIRRLDRGSQIVGSVISSYSSDISVFTEQDYEIFLVRSRASLFKKILDQISIALPIAAASGAAASAISGLLG